jgi:hypothetical protein
VLRIDSVGLWLKPRLDTVFGDVDALDLGYQLEEVTYSVGVASVSMSVSESNESQQVNLAEEEVTFFPKSQTRFCVSSHIKQHCNFNMISQEVFQNPMDRDSGAVLILRIPF